MNSAAMINHNDVARHQKFGGKDHSTIIHSVKKIDLQIAQDLEIKGTIDNLRRGLLS